jgi:hypothetical protein
MHGRPPIALLTLAWYLLLIPIALSWSPQNTPSRSQALGATDLPPEAAALSVLASSPQFYSAQVGIGGTIPPQVYAWNALLQMPRADTLFATLLRVGTLPGQLYALAGLYYADSLAFRAAAPRLAQLHASVQVMRGCSSLSWDVADLVQDIRTGSWSMDLATARQDPLALPLPSN